MQVIGGGSRPRGDSGVSEKNQDVQMVTSETAEEGDDRKRRCVEAGTRR